MTASTDLDLARAAAAGDTAALLQVERRVETAARGAARALRQGPSFAAELAQVLKTRLLVAEPGARPRLAGYRGQGTLDAFLKASAVRAGLNLLEAPVEASLARAPATLAADPEVRLMQRRYAPVFRTALEQVLRGLPSDERTLLRLFFVDGFSTEQIGVIRRAHKSTVSRWLAKVREQVIAECRARLQRELDVDASELESLTRLLQSQLELSLAALAAD